MPAAVSFLRDRGTCAAHLPEPDHGLPCGEALAQHLGLAWLRGCSGKASSLNDANQSITRSAVGCPHPARHLPVRQAVACRNAAGPGCEKILITTFLGRRHTNRRIVDGKSLK
jgi:hypothetical protein